MIPSDFLKLVFAMHSKKEADTGLTFFYSDDKKNISFYKGDVTVTTKVIDAPYPQFNQVIPREFSAELVLEFAVTPTKTLKNHIKGGSRYCFVTMVENECSTTDVVSCPVPEIKVINNTFEAPIGFNLSFLALIGNGLKGQFTMKGNVSISATVITTETELMLLMPLRIT